MEISLTRNVNKNRNSLANNTFINWELMGKMSGDGECRQEQGSQDNERAHDLEAECSEVLLERSVGITGEWLLTFKKEAIFGRLDFTDYQGYL